MRRITLVTNPDVCNLCCPLCFLNQRRCGERVFGMGEMPFETAWSVIEKYAAERDASGKRILREVIPSTMGEPLLYSHFDELLELCKSLEIPLNLTTNGTFPGKWGSESGLETLLRSCSDIKVSYLASEQFEGWKSNVEKLLNVRNSLVARGTALGGWGAQGESAENVAWLATVSLQVTLHKKNLKDAPSLVKWASAIGINRIKWNPAVLLKDAPTELKREYALNCNLDEIRRLILDVSKSCQCNIKNEGSLFMNNMSSHFSKEAGICPFANEVWILPDGSKDHCPSPERRYGDKNAECCFIKFDEVYVNKHFTKFV